MKRVALAVLLLTAAGEARASNSETSFELFPQAEYIQAETPQAARGILETKFRYKDKWVQFSFDAFAIGDLAPDAPDLRGDRNVFALQEAYVEYHLGEFFSVRAGRTPVRWSESWTLPSLDIWTGRRWNEMFFLPVPYQLVHPTGVLMTYDNGTTTVSGFANLLPAYDIYPPNFAAPPSPREGVEFGVKAKTRLAGFDIAAVAAQQRAQNVFGGNVSYAFDWVVPKIEGGVNDRKDKFGTLGLDFFFGDFSILPQFTVFQSDFVPYDYERILYLPIRYATESDSIEIQAYGNLETEDQFYSLLYTHTFRNGLQLTGYVQSYLGDPGTLFGFYQNLTNGPAFGFRIGDDISL